MHVSNFFSQMKKLNWKTKKKEILQKRLFTTSSIQDPAAFQQQTKHKQKNPDKFHSIIPWHLLKARKKLLQLKTVKVRNVSDQSLAISTAYTWYWSNSLEQFGWQFPVKLKDTNILYIPAFCLIQYWGTLVNWSFCIILPSASSKNQVKNMQVKENINEWGKSVWNYRRSSLIKNEKFLQQLWWKRKKTIFIMFLKSC